jgi:hypothetical protein
MLRARRALTSFSPVGVCLPPRCHVAALPEQFVNLPNLVNGAPLSIIEHAVKVIMASDENADAQDTFYITGKLLV